MIEIIPAIDLIDGKCVRLMKGDYAQKTIYNTNPLEVAREFEDAGLSRLHLVDLDGAKMGKIVNHQVLKQIASGTSLSVDFSGGIKTGEDMETVFSCGADYAIIGSMAVRDSELFYRWLAKYGSNKIFLSADVKDGNIAINGWQERTAIDLFDFLEENILQGVINIVCTDISKDGLLQGCSTGLYQQVLSRFPAIKLVASGGVTTMDDIAQLDTIGCHGVIIGRAIYEGKIMLKELADFISSNT